MFIHFLFFPLAFLFLLFLYFDPFCHDIFDTFNCPTALLSLIHSLCTFTDPFTLSVFFINVTTLLSYLLASLLFYLLSQAHALCVCVCQRKNMSVSACAFAIKHTSLIL